MQVVSPIALVAAVAPVNAAIGTLDAGSDSATGAASGVMAHFSQWLHATADTQDAASASTESEVASAASLNAGTADTQTGSGGTQTPAQETSAGALALLVAQQLGTTPKTKTIPTSSDSATINLAALDHVVTPQEAAAALDVLNQQGTQDDFTTRLKAVLSDIKNGAAPQTIGDIVTKLVAVQSSSSATQISQAMQRAVKLLQAHAAQNADAASTDATSEDTSATPDTARDSALIESLAASLFRTGADTPPSQTPPQSVAQAFGISDDDAIRVTIEPLSQQGQMLIAGADVSTATQAKSLADAQAAPSLSSQNTLDVQEHPPLDALVPPMAAPTTTAAEENNDADLPQVTLPTARGDVDSALQNGAVNNHSAANSVSATAQAQDAASDRVLARHAAASAALNTAGAEHVNTTALRAAAGDAVEEKQARAQQSSAQDTATNAVNLANNAAAQSQTRGEAGAANRAADAKDASADAVQSVNAQTRAAGKAATLATSRADEAASADSSAGNVKTAAAPFATLLAQEVSSGRQTSAASATASSSAVVPAPATEQVHVAVSRAVKDGINNITIQLDPADLGRVEVKMHTGNDGQTQISFTVDKPSTLDSLSRGAHGLERSLQDAGVKTDAGNMQFNLRQQPQTMDTGTGAHQGGGRQQSAAANDTGAATTARSTAENASASSVATTSRHYTLNISNGLDIHA